MSSLQLRGDRHHGQQHQQQQGPVPWQLTIGERPYMTALLTCGGRWMPTYMLGAASSLLRAAWGTSPKEAVKGLEMLRGLRRAAGEETRPLAPALKGKAVPKGKGARP